MRTAWRTARSVRRALVVAGFGWACSISGCSHKAAAPSSITEAGASDESALRERLRAAWRAKGPDYVPRTRHKNPDGSPKYTNRLILESSPYLLQHAHNPVDWHPWGDEAFAIAKAERRPVFLSVGYSTCHWCHVMEEESFEDEATAAYINEHYVPIKVDREDRPDIDAVYMGFVQALTGGGGWPMNVWLTPGREPFFGGTYFAPHAGVHGARRGFLDVLRELSERFQEQGAEVASEAAAFSKRMQESVAPAPAGDFPSPSLLKLAVEQASGRFDGTFGGARGAPKFPSSFPVRMLLRFARRTKDAIAPRMAAATLAGMDAGGIHDAIGGGFHRYATDSRWLVPHFEKMLYDNALLATAYLEAGEATGEARFLATAESTLDYLLRDMRAPDGTFFAATDADSPSPGGKREEGLYFTWTPSELHQALGADDARVAAAWFAVTEAGNFEGRTVLSTPRASADVARDLAIPAKQLEGRVADIRRKLLDARARKIPPDRDEKVIVAWNALAVSALARAAIALGEPRYADAAIRAATGLIAEPRAKRPLPHVLLGGHPQGKGFADDHVLLAAALLDVFELTSDAAWLDDATALMEEVERSFRDPVQGGYFLTGAQHESLLTRDKPDDDGPVPSASSVAALTWLRLCELTGDERFRARAETTLRAFSRELEARPLGQEHMLFAVDWASDLPKEIVVVVPEGKGALASTARPLLAVLAHSFVPNAFLVVATEAELGADLGKRIPSASGKRLRDGRATAYVCERGTCQLPTHDPDVLAHQLADARPYP